MGFRALRLRDRFDLVHMRAHPVRPQHASGMPLVMSSEGSSSIVYLGWDDDPDRGAPSAARSGSAVGVGKPGGITSSFSESAPQRRFSWRAHSLNTYDRVTVWSVRKRSRTPRARYERDVETLSRRTRARKLVEILDEACARSTVRRLSGRDRV